MSLITLRQTRASYNTVTVTIDTVTDTTHIDVVDPTYLVVGLSLYEGGSPTDNFITDVTGNTVTFDSAISGYVDTDPITFSKESVKGAPLFNEEVDDNFFKLMEQKADVNGETFVNNFRFGDSGDYIVLDFTSGEFNIGNTLDVVNIAGDLIAGTITSPSNVVSLFDGAVSLAGVDGGGVELGLQVSPYNLPLVELKYVDAFSSWTASAPSGSEDIGFRGYDFTSDDVTITAGYETFRGVSAKVEVIDTYNTNLDSRLLAYETDIFGTAVAPVYTEENYLVDGDTFQTALDTLDQELWDVDDLQTTLVNDVLGTNTAPTYTEDNIVAEGDDFQTAIDKIDIALGILGAGDIVTLPFETVDTTPVTITKALTIVNTDTAASDVALTLPTSTGGYKVDVKRLGTGGDVIITPASGTVEGASTLTLNAPNQSITLVCDGTNWYII